MIISVIDIIWFESNESISTVNVSFEGGLVYFDWTRISDPQLNSSCPEMLAKSGTYSDCSFSNWTNAEITSGTIRLIRCFFHDIFRKGQGSAARCQCLVIASYTNFTNCSGSVGHGIAIQSWILPSGWKRNGIGQFDHCWFIGTYRHPASPNFFESPSFGGALGIMDGANCTCLKCHFVSNLDGAISIVGICFLIECELINNSGSFGGVLICDRYNENTTYMRQDDCSLVDIRESEFRGNRGHSNASYGNDLYINSSITIHISNCSFASESGSSIYYECDCNSSISSSCFIGSHFHLYSRIRVDVFVSGLICFSNALSHCFYQIDIQGDGLLHGHCVHCLPGSASDRDPPTLPFVITESFESRRRARTPPAHRIRR
jgi:hypothetical protein